MSLSSKIDETIEKHRNEISPLVEQNAREFLRNCPEYFKNYQDWVVDIPIPFDAVSFNPVPLLCALGRGYVGKIYASISLYIFEEEIKIIYRHSLDIQIEAIFKIPVKATESYEKNYSIRLAAHHLSHLMALA